MLYYHQKLKQIYKIDTLTSEDKCKILILVVFLLTLFLIMIIELQRDFSVV